MIALPTYSALAALFWITLALVSFSSIRRKVAALLILPGATNQHHLASLDAFRGLAALSVAVFHTWQWPRPIFDSVLDWVTADLLVAIGQKAVPVFVTLSGLLIYRSLARVQTIDELRGYIVRRFLRVLPVFLATVIIAIALFSPFDVNFPPLQMGIAEIFMLRSLGFPGFINPQTWSLYVEVLFYALAPVFVIAAGRRPLWWALVALVVFALGDVAGPREIGLWKYFCFGIIAAEIINRAALEAKEATVLAIAGAVVVIIDITYEYDWLAKTVNYLSVGAIKITGGQGPILPGGVPPYTLSIGVGMVMLIVGAVQAPLFRSVLETAPLRMLGAISYSLFMWHSFLIAADFPVTITITFTGHGGGPHAAGAMAALPFWYLPAIVIPGLLSLSAISFVLIERPFLLLGHKASKRPDSKIS